MLFRELYSGCQVLIFSQTVLCFLKTYLFGEDIYSCPHDIRIQRNIINNLCIFPRESFLFQKRKIKVKPQNEFRILDMFIHTKGKDIRKRSFSMISEGVTRATHQSHSSSNYIFNLFTSQFLIFILNIPGNAIII